MNSAFGLSEIRDRLAASILAIHRRNGGKLVELDWQWKLLEPGLLLDSLDLAEIMVMVEKEFGCSPFEVADPPQNWKEIVHRVEAIQLGKRTEAVRPPGSLTSNSMQ